MEDNNFNYIQNPNLTEIFNLINEHSSIVIAQEIELVKSSSPIPDIRTILVKQLEEYQNQIKTAAGKYAISRIGKGKTLFFNTILPLLRKDVRKSVIDVLKRKEGNFPRSRVLTVKDKHMFGWIKLSSQQENFTKQDIDFGDNVPKVQPKASVPLEKKVIDNTVGKIEEGIQIKAYYYVPKNIDIQINGKLIENVTLTKVRVLVRSGDLVTLEIKQMTNDGRINQVSIIKRR